MAIISNLEDTTIHSALADMTGHPFDHLPHVLYKASLNATQNNGTTHDLLLDEQWDAMIEANEPLLVYLARHLAIHARLVKASAPNTSISKTIKAIVRGMSRSGQHAFAYSQISIKHPTSMAAMYGKFTTLQPSVDALVRHKSTKNADARKQPRHERDRQRRRRSLCNYPRPDERPANLNWCTVHGSGGHNTVDCRQAQAVHTKGTESEFATRRWAWPSCILSLRSRGRSLQHPRWCVCAQWRLHTE
jgi:hypothetical protein